MGVAIRIAKKDLTLRVRDRSAFILGIIAPLTLAFIFNAVLGNAASGTGLGLEYGIVDLDGSEISAAFVEALEGAEQADVLTLDSFLDAVAAAEAVESGDIDAYFVVPAGFSQAVMSNQASTIDVFGDVDAPTSTGIAKSFAEQFASRVAASQLAVATTAVVSGRPPMSMFDSDPASAAMSFQITDASADTRQLDATTYFAAGMAALFLFFTVAFGVTGLLDEEREGTLARLMAAPIAREAVIGGKAIVAFVLGVVSMGVLVVATTFLMGANWGAPLGVAVLVVAGVLSAVGIMGLVASLAKTAEGAGNLSSIIAVILGMLGGSFFPIGTEGGILARLTYLTPHAWFLRGLGDLAGDAPWTHALPAAGAIAVIATVTCLIAWFLMRRRWAR
ncbi:MAG TPA: ABC transporter permease [Acidimicrobiia bacterium]|jgi:ABC-2 type transport system permease protein|nr:ABC transporter permease [Acidimicrobiia bacterium]